MVKWLLEEDKIFIDDGDRKIFPGASGILGAEFHDLSEIDGVKVPGYPSEAFPEISFSRFPGNLRFSLRPQKSHLELRLKMVSGKIVIDLPELPKADYILSGGQWIPVQQDEIVLAGKIMSECGIACPGFISIRQGLQLAEKLPDLVDIDEAPREAGCGGSNPQGEIKDLNVVPYPYQKEGISWLRALADMGTGGLLADEMGLGKTLQIIGLLTVRVHEGQGQSLIICPATLLENWRRELARFSPGLKVLVHSGSDRTGNPSDLRTYDVVLISWNTAANDKALLGMIDWDMLIVDEAQGIKNPHAQRTRSVKDIRRIIGIAVSGTPVENSLRDLWSIMDFICPGIFGPLKDFENKYPDDADAAKRLDKLISPLVLRRSVVDVANDLPEKIIIPQAIPMNGEMSGPYEKLREEAVSASGKNPSFGALIKLRQFCCHPILAGYDCKAENFPKFSRLLEVAAEIASNKEKCLIFTSFRKMADIIAAQVKQNSRIFTSVIDGRTPVEERQEIIDRFTSHTGAGFLVLNPKAAGTGLNITAATHVIHYNPEWNPATEDQATARAYRRGQKRPVTIHKFFIPGTVEEVMHDRLDRKRDLASAAVSISEDAQADIKDIIKALGMSPAAYITELDSEYPYDL